MPSHSDADTKLAIPPPPGKHSNLVTPPNSDRIFIVFCVLLILLSTPWVLLRLYTRLRIKPKLWWDDLEKSLRDNHPGSII